MVWYPTEFGPVSERRNGRLFALRKNSAEAQADNIGKLVGGVSEGWLWLHTEVYG
jgi:hypothetical protein